MTLSVDWSRPPRACETPGCDHPRWHVCLVGKKDHTNILLNREIRKKKNRRRRTDPMGPMSDEQRDSISAAQKKRWAEFRRNNEERDDALVARYKEGGVSISALAVEFNTSRNSVRTVLNTAEKEGRVVLRKQGQNVRFEKVEAKVL